MIIKNSDELRALKYLGIDLKVSTRQVIETTVVGATEFSRYISSGQRARTWMTLERLNKR